MLRAAARVSVRLLLLSGLAAAAALVVRERVAARALTAIALPTFSMPALGGRAQEAAPSPTVAEHPSPTVAEHAVAAPAVPPAAKTAHAMKKAAHAPARFVITRTALDDAIAKRGYGARATVLRDEAGKALGIALHGVAAFAKYGVADGDVLLAANGMPLRTADEALAALGALGEARHVDVLLRRGEATFTVPLDLDGP